MAGPARRPLWFCFIVTILLASPAFAEDRSGWYVGVEGGATFQQDLTFHVEPVVFRPYNISAAFDPGPCIRLRAGYDFNRFLGLELEAGYSENDIATLNGTPLPISGAVIRQVPVMANVVLTHPLSSRWSVYFGGGVGGVVSQWNLGPGPIYATLNVTSPATDFTFGYQGTAGIRYELSHHWDCGIAYKFLGTAGHHEWAFGSESIVADPTFAHSIVASITFHF